MKGSQWFVLSITFLLLMIIFISFDTTALSCGVEGKPLTAYDIYCLINSEIYEPFIWMFPILFIAFSICGCLEPKKK